jgi:hypothetical protein
MSFCTLTVEQNKAITKIDEKEPEPTKGRADAPRSRVPLKAKDKEQSQPLGL